MTGILSIKTGNNEVMKYISQEYLLAKVYKNVGSRIILHFYKMKDGNS